MYVYKGDLGSSIMRPARQRNSAPDCEGRHNASCAPAPRIPALHKAVFLLFIKCCEDDVKGVPVRSVAGVELVAGVDGLYCWVLVRAR